MMNFNGWIVALALAMGTLLVSAGKADTAPQKNLDLYGDVRVRLEADFDSQREDGSERDDRNRLRIRVRLGLTYALNEQLSLGLRVRSGSDNSQQSPHITLYDFDGDDRGDAHFNFDKWYAKFQGEKAWAWMGRNGLPFFKQNELFLDDDVTAAGLAFGWKTGLNHGGHISANAGFFTPPVGMQDFAGSLGLGQLVYQHGDFTVAGGLLRFDASTSDGDAVRLLRGNGLRDYTIWVGSLQWKTQLGSRPLVLGADVSHNSESYSATDPDPFTARNRDQIDGRVFSVRYGSTKEKGDWLVAWYHAHIETFAVNASYGQDDWMRWGSLTENRNSGFEGHEFRFAYALAKDRNLVFRFYQVEAITNVEDGSRFRVDFNYRF